VWGEGGGGDCREVFLGLGFLCWMEFRSAMVSISCGIGSHLSSNDRDQL
jgi:hypothetical protein